MVATYIGINHLNYPMIYTDKTTNLIHNQLIIRRNLLKNLTFILPVVSFSPSLGTNEESDRSNQNQLTSFERESISAFIQAVIPDSEDYCRALLAELDEDFYGFSKYLRFLIKCLNQAALSKFNRSFAQLDIFEIKSFLDAALDADVIDGQKYNNGIRMLKLIAFAGLSEDGEANNLEFPNDAKDSYPEFYLYNTKAFSDLKSYQKI